jgi:hypothetical protein
MRIFKVNILYLILLTACVYGQYTYKIRIAVAEPHMPWVDSKMERRAFSDMIAKEFSNTKSVILIDSKLVYDSMNDYEGDCDGSDCAKFIGKRIGAHAVVITALYREGNSYSGSIGLFGTATELMNKSVRILHLGGYESLGQKIKQAPWKLLGVDIEVIPNNENKIREEKSMIKSIFFVWVGIMGVTFLL